MITCPVCGKPVHVSKDERDTSPYLSDDSTADFDCPTMVDVAPGRRWHHYNRRTLQGSWPAYAIVHPPFEIIWWDDGRLVVEQFDYKVIDRPSIGNPPGQTTINRKIVLEKRKTTFQDFLHTATRFKNLVIFS